MPSPFAVAPSPPLRCFHSLSSLHPMSRWNIARFSNGKLSLFSPIDIKEGQKRSYSLFYDNSQVELLTITGFLNIINRQTLIFAVNQEAEESFKKIVEVDRLIDTMRDANGNELQKLVVENVLAFNESFWLRLAARTETCKSEDDKAWFLLGRL
ncbi:hypothetical protein RHMOL_Rhmol05G0080500 [Rhododendron molle]|uniref:Uncharacterized protein n=1 Tax=Rhododendron molle TaxID=49168 RepID=A0ACC0NNP1_RHOML|nr:hypothetical protein RHMOL_Rhmol05G0080500 [Rhododendron molle]